MINKDNKMISERAGTDFMRDWTPVRKSTEARTTVFKM